MSERLRFLSGDVNYLAYGGKWISKKHNNGDFDYWYVVELINMHEATGEEDQPKYSLSISVVAPSEAPENERISAHQSCGSDHYGGLNEYPIELQVDTLHSYGISASIWVKAGNSFKELWKEGHDELGRISMLFGYYMDRPVNMLGATGWDILKGDIGIDKFRHKAEARKKEVEQDELKRSTRNS